MTSSLLWKTDEYGPVAGDLPIQIVSFHSYVKLPEGNQNMATTCHKYIQIYNQFRSTSPIIPLKVADLLVSTPQ